MAGQQNYYEEPAEEGYYDEDEYAEEGAGTGDDLSAIASVPWVAIALAIHIILLTVFYFVRFQAEETQETETIQAQQEQVSVPPEPETPPEDEVEFPKDEPVKPDPSEDEQIVEKPNDTVNEDPTDQPSEELAENPNDNDSDNKSPHPNTDSSTSAIGLGGGAGGGGGRGGAGGFAYRRAGGGGGRPHQDRTKSALEWLKDHQNDAGHWSSTTFSDDSKRTGEKTYNIEFVDVGEADGDKGWEQTTDIGLTGMALLAFLGAGHDHTMGDYKQTCRNAIQYLRRNQGQDGCFGAQEDDHFVYNHSICTMAMAEAYGLSNQAVLKPYADNAVDFILRCQNPGLGWRYGVQPGQNDSSVTGWMVLALKSCKMAGLSFDYSKSYANAAEWYGMVTIEVGGYLKVGYKSPGSVNARLRGATDYDHNPSMDSIYVMSMLFMNKRTLKDKDIKELAFQCVQKEVLPKWEQNRIDYYFWYYASLALFQVGGSTWTKWESAMSKTLLDSQRGYHKMDLEKGRNSKDALDEHGSWDAVDAWGSAGGRVYSTAINALTLEVYYRYLKQNKDK